MRNYRSLREVLAQNIRTLLERYTDIPITTLAKRSGLTTRTLHYYLLRERSAGIDNLDAIAGVYGLSGHHILMPNFHPDILKGGVCDELCASYFEASESARNFIKQATDMAVPKSGAELGYSGVGGDLEKRYHMADEGTRAAIDLLLMFSVDGLPMNNDAAEISVHVLKQLAPDLVVEMRDKEKNGA